MIKDELKTLFKKPILVLVLLVIMLIPAIYAGCFLSSMWDPYGDLDKLPVAVVNNDQSVQYNGKELSIGNDLVEKLKDDKSLNFSFVNEDKANLGLEDGTYYMSIIIPKDFSYNASTVIDKDPVKMGLSYKTNPATNYVASKLSESGMNKIQAKLNETVSRTYIETLFDQLKGIGISLKDASNGAGKIYTGETQVYDGANKLCSGSKELDDGASSLSNGTSNLLNGINSLKSGADTLKSGSNNLSNGLNTLNYGAKNVSDGLYALSIASQAIPSLTSSSSNFQSSLSSFASSIGTAENVSNTEEETVTKDVYNQLVNSYNQLAGRYNFVSSSAATLTSSYNQLNSGIQSLNSITPTLSVLSQGASSVSQGTKSALDGAKQVENGIVSLSNGLDTTKEGTKVLNNGAISLKDGSSKLHNGLFNLTDGIPQLLNGTKTLESALSNGADEIGKTNTQENNVSMISKPIETNEEQITTVTDNGHAMAAYMLSVGLWVACLAFCLMYPLTSHKKLTNGFNWWASKAIILYPLAILQSIVVIYALKVFLGFSPINLAQTIAMSCLTSIAFMSIMYFFNVLLGKVGSFIMLIFMVLQLAGSAGTYPIELSGTFAQTLHKFMPFTYTVNAFRSTIGGGSSYNSSILVLVLLTIIFTLLTIALFIIRSHKEKNGESSIYDWLDRRGLA